MKCQIWDTAGQERFHVITQGQFRVCRFTISIIALRFPPLSPVSFLLFSSFLSPCSPSDLCCFPFLLYLTGLCLLAAYYRSAQGIVLVYDASDMSRESIDSEWREAEVLVGLWCDGGMSRCWILDG